MVVGNEISTIKTEEHKKRRLRQFLNALAQDESLLGETTGSQALQLEETGCPISQELVYDYRIEKHVPSGHDSQIDLAELLTLALNKNGISKGVEELMDHMLQGGSLSKFL